MQSSALATLIVFIEKVSDIETARERLGHSNITQTGDYLHTNEKRMKQAMQRRGVVK